MKKRAVNTYLKPKTIVQIEKTFSTTYQGMKVTTESFFVLRNYSMKEIRGTFNENEVVALLKLYRGVTFERLNPSFSGISFRTSPVLTYSYRNHGVLILLLVEYPFGQKFQNLTTKEKMS